MFVFSRLLVLFLCGVSLFSSAKHQPALSFYAEASPPLIFRDEQGQPRGAMADIVKELLRRTGLDGDIILMPWARAYSEASSQENVILLNTLKTQSRIQKLKWLGKVYEIQGHFISVKSQGRRSLNNIDQAKQSIVGSVRGYGTSYYLQENGFVEDENLVLTSDSDTLWKMLFSGRLDYVVTNLEVGRHQVDLLGLPSEDLSSALLIKEPTLSTELHLATGLTTSVDITRQLKGALQDMKDEGSYEKIMRQWEL